MSERAEWDKRVARAKGFADSIIRASRGPGAALVPADLKAALADGALLLVELAQLSHAKFDMSPHDFPQLVRRVESLESFKASMIRRSDALSDSVVHLEDKSDG